jgi:erythromycin esterase
MKEDPNLKHFISWAKEHAVPINTAASKDDFSDLAPLKEVIGDARVVGFGESLHYVGEFTRFRSRLFKYLVKEMNFTTFAFECGPIEAKCTYDYVLGVHDRFDDAVMGITDIFGVWDGIQDLIQWMREYNLNDNNKQKLKFYGFDDGNGWSSAETAVSFACDYLDQVDSKYASKIRKDLLPLANSIDLDNVAEKPLEKVKELNCGLISLVARFQIEQMHYIERSNWDDFDWAYRATLIAQRIGSLLGEVHAAPEASMRIWWNIRDGGMAWHLNWIREREGSDARMLLGAHNCHLQKTFADEGLGFDQSTTGQYLSVNLPKKDLLIIGGTNYYGLKPDDPAIEGSFQDALGRLELPSFVLDLRAATNEKKATSWLDKKMPDREHTSYQPTVIADAWDAIFYTEEIALDKLSLPTPLERSFINLESDRLDGLVGVYDIDSVVGNPVVLCVMREDNCLMTSGEESDGELFPMHQSELFPVSDSRFGWADWPLWIEFERDADGVAHSVNLGHPGKQGYYRGTKRR